MATRHKVSFAACDNGKLQGIPFDNLTDHIEDYQLAADVVKQVTPPAWAKTARIHHNDPSNVVYMRLNNDPASAPAAQTSGTGARTLYGGDGHEYNVNLDAVTTLRFRSAGTGIVTIEYWGD